VATATTVRVRNGKVSVTDGPFAETKEYLAGFYLIEARDLNEAIQLARKFSGKRRKHRGPPDPADRPQPRARTRRRAKSGSDPRFFLVLFVGSDPDFDYVHPPRAAGRPSR